MDDIIELLLDPSMEAIYDDTHIIKLIKIAVIESMIDDLDQVPTPWFRAIFSATEPTKTLMAFSILKWIDPDRSIDILVGTENEPGWSIVEDGVLIGEGGKNPVCSGSRLYEDEPLYRWIPPPEVVVDDVESCSLPEGKDNIMKWLYLTRMMNDHIVDQVNDLVTASLEVGSIFYDMILDSPVIHERWRIPLILAVLKTKASRIADEILHVYVPDTCNVPN